MAATFNPESVRFIASRYGLSRIEELEPMLGFPAHKLNAWAKGKAAPTNDEAILLMHKTQLPFEWFTVEEESPALAA